MYLKYNPKTLKYYGESTYDTPDGLQVGDKAYFFNTEKNVVWNGTTWIDDMVNTDAFVSNTSPIEVTSGASKSSVTHTRPNNTTAYAIGDVVGTDPATNLSFSDVSTIAGGYVIITGVSLEIDVGSVPSGMSSFRLHLYDSAPTAITDNLAYNLPSADRSKYLGYIEIYAPSDLGDTLWVRVDNVNLLVKLANGSTTLYSMLETRAAYTPSAQAVKKVTLYCLEV